MGAALRRTFSSVRTSRNFRLYLFGQFVSAAGTWMNFTASAWLVLRLTDDGVALGINTALLFLPMLLLGAWGGSLADRFDKRKILIGTQAAFAFLSLVLFALVWTDLVELWMVYVLSLLSGLVVAIDNPTRQSFYAEMVGVEHVTNAVSLNSAVFTGSRVIGPAVAGILIATAGIEWPFLLDAVSYLAVLVALMMMRPAEFHPQARTSREHGLVRAAFRYVWETDELRRPLVVMAIIFTVSMNFAVFVPLLAERTFDGNAGTFGLLSALAGVGSFFGAMTMATRADQPTMRRLGLWAVALGITLAVPGLAPSLPLAALSMIPLGFVVMAFMITGNTMLQLTARPEARGRVMALYGMVFLGSTPIGSPIAGWLGETFGARWGFVVSGLVASATGVALLALLRRHRAAEEALQEAQTQANEGGAAKNPSPIPAR
jgi:MFS family permease